MAKAKRVFKCKKCGKVFTNGRSLGDHYKQSPKCRPPKKVVKHRKVKKAATKAAKTVGRVMGFDARVKQLKAELNAEIAAHAKAIKSLQAKCTKLDALL